MLRSAETCGQSQIVYKFALPSRAFDVAQCRPQPNSLEHRWFGMTLLGIICCLLAVPALLTFWE
jgi:hypothetical protein